MTIVSTMPTAKKVFTALVIAAPLTLVACGSGEADSESSSSAVADSASTVTSTTAAAAPKTEEAAPEDKAREDEAKARESQAEAEAEEKAEAKGESAEAGEAEKPAGDTVAPAVPDAQGANAGAEQTIANPFEEGEQMQGTAQEPVEGGAPAGQEDADAINALVNGIYQQTTLNGLVEYVPNNTCQAVLANSDWDPNYDTQGVPDMPLDQIPQFQQAQPTVDAVDNLSVAGDQASADVTVTSGGQTDTSTMRFLREGGSWKFCSSVV